MASTARPQRLFRIIMISAAMLALAAGAPARAQQTPTVQRAEDVRAALGQAVPLIQAGNVVEAEAMIARIAASASDALGPGHPEALFARIMHGTILLLRSDYAGAARILESAVPEAQARLGPAHETTIRGLQGLAQLNFHRGRWDESERQYAQVAAAFERSFGLDHPNTLLALSTLASHQVRQGRAAEAERILLRVVPASERVQGRDHPDTGVAVAALAQAYIVQGRFVEAEPLYIRVYTTLERTAGPDHPNTLEAMQSLGAVYVRQRRYSEAEAVFTRALERIERRLGPDELLTIGAQDNLAGVYHSQNRLPEAEALLRRAVAASGRRLGPDHPQSLRVLDSLAGVLATRRQFGEAETLYRRELEARTRLQGEENIDALAALGNLALMLNSQQRHAEAEPLYQRAVALLERTLGPDHPSTLRQLQNFASARLWNPERQRLAIEPARRLVAGARRRRAGERATLLTGAGQDAENSGAGNRFDLLLNAAWVARDPARDDSALREDAFGAVQESLAGPASSAIARMAVRRLSGNRPGLDTLARERETLVEQLDANNAAFGASFGQPGDLAGRREGLRGERAALEARLREVDLRLRRDAPDYLALIQPDPMSIAEAQRLLRPDEGILVLAPTAQGTHVMAITPGNLHWRRSASNLTFVNQTVQRLRWDLGARVSVPDDQLAQWRAEAVANPRQRYDRMLAYIFYQDLIEGVMPTLAGVRRLYVVASGPLASLPLSVLVTERPSGADDDPGALRATRWFADSFALVHIPSLQSLALLRQSEGAGGRREDGGFVGVGDPQLSGASPGRDRGARNARGGPDAGAILGRAASRSGGALADVAALRRLARLEGSRGELENLGRAFGDARASLLLGADATEPQVRGTDFSRARVIAFATHGLTAGEIDSLAEPGLVLTPPATASEQDDGYLAASEVAALRLDADWVILSACNTATGDATDGLSGLARAFFYAGARGLLASHWPVADAVAPRITVRTVELQQGGTGRAEAFQQALREIRMDASQDAVENGSLAHPFYWAPFVLIGDGG